MSRKEWGALVVVLEVVLGLQLVGHDGAGDSHGEGHAGQVREAPERPPTGSPESRAQQGIFRTVNLQVRGMT